MCAHSQLSSHFIHFLLHDSSDSKNAVSDSHGSQDANSQRPDSRGNRNRRGPRDRSGFDGLGRGNNGRQNNDGNDRGGRGRWVAPTGLSFFTANPAMLKPRQFSSSSDSNRQGQVRHPMDVSVSSGTVTAVSTVPEEVSSHSTMVLSISV